MRRLRWAVIGVLVIAGALFIFIDRGPKPGEVQDEAMRAGLSVEDFPPAGRDFEWAARYGVDPDYFAELDNGIVQTEDAVKGRNMWLLWTGGNDWFWDELVNHSFGTFDLLKTISSPPATEQYARYKYNRDNRWEYFGLINEPCFRKPEAPDPERFGLWLDQRDPDCPPDPFADPVKYPGVQLGARGEEGLPVGSYYGEPTGIVGLRLFTNPAFDAEARERWDPERYYNDPTYYQDPDLVRPYRVGMSCAFCHIGPSPINPPADPENPEWSELNSTVGSQYFWFDRVFAWEADPSNFIYQMLHSYLPGALDTSLVSTDNIDNPRTMNALYNTTARLMNALPHGKELLAGGELDNSQFNDFPNTGALDQLFDEPHVYAARILKDGADSVGALGALNRVYLNIGLFGEEWLLHFNAFAGGKRITPILIADAQKNSVYWQATEQQTIFMAKYLLEAAQPDLLEDVAPGELADPETIAAGETVFAETCARCHSSKLPEPVIGMEGEGAENCNGPDYMACWNRYWEWTKTDDFKTQMLGIVRAPDFRDNNYLSTEFRIPVTLLETNACSPLARNALEGNIWDNFSSQSYKSLPSVGTIEVRNPFTGDMASYDMPAGGRGYTRPPSLVSLWSTAPFLLNNSVGIFDSDPSVATRLDVFDDSIRKMLWPERRQRDPVLGAKGVGVIARTDRTSWFKLPTAQVPTPVYVMRGPINWLFPGVFKEDGSMEIGPIPANTPVYLLGNFDLLPEEEGFWPVAKRSWQVLRMLARFRHDLVALDREAADLSREPSTDGTEGYAYPGVQISPFDRRATEVLTPLGQSLYELGTCPDYEINRGHYFGTELFEEEPALTDSERNALIEYLKTL